MILWACLVIIWFCALYLIMWYGFLGNLIAHKLLPHLGIISMYQSTLQCNPLLQIRVYIPAKSATTEPRERNGIRTITRVDVALPHTFQWGKKPSQGSDSKFDYTIPSAITCRTTQALLHGASKKSYNQNLQRRGLAQFQRLRVAAPLGHAKSNYLYHQKKPYNTAP